jgi:peptide/nickel transport system permease protein
VATSAALVGLSVPHFWLGLMMISFFAVRLHWLPASGYVPFTQNPYENLRHMVMPAIVLGTGLSAVLMRQMRSSMLTSLGADYVRTARAKGLPERSVVLKHALRNSLITVTTIIGVQLGILISGVVVTESIFVIPGYGRLTLDAVSERDYPLLQGVVLVAAAGYVIVNLTVDVLYSVLNPRIRVAGARN